MLRKYLTPPMCNWSVLVADPRKFHGLVTVPASKFSHIELLILLRIGRACSRHARRNISKDVNAELRARRLAVPPTSVPCLKIFEIFYPRQKVAVSRLFRSVLQHREEFFIVFHSPSFEISFRSFRSVGSLCECKKQHGSVPNARSNITKYFEF